MYDFHIGQDSIAILDVFGEDLHIPFTEDKYDIRRLMPTALKYFKDNYDADFNVDNFRKQLIFSPDEKPEGSNLVIALTDKGIGFALELLHKEIVKLTKSIKDKEAHFKNNGNYPDDSYKYLADDLNNFLKYKIKLKVLKASFKKIEMLFNNEITELYLSENFLVMTLIQNLINKEVGNAVENNNIKEIRYQYKTLAMNKAAKNGTDTYSATQSMLTYISNTRLYDPDNSVKLIRAEAKQTIKEKDISLKQLYPSLKQELKSVRKFSKLRSLEPTANGMDWGAIEYLFINFNNIKCKLMLLGYKEDRVTKFLAQSVFKSKHNICEITKQILPVCFLIPLRKLDGTIIKANMYYMYQCLNRTGRRTDGYSRYSISENSKFIKEVEGFPEEHYYGSMLSEHNANILTLLTPRALPNQDTKVHNKNRGYRPVPYLGVELEVERAPDCPATITEQCFDALGRDFVIFKHDGSLRGNNPFEIVTVPATLEYHKKAWGKFMDDKELKKHLISYKSGNCGIHVHISRDSFTGLHLAKFMRFINCDENHRFIIKLAQRGHCNYNRYAPMSIMESAKMIQHGVHGHYDSVNTSNANTVEVRIFRGNLSKTAFFKNLEFVHALWAYTQTCSLKELNYKKFLYWLFDSNNHHDNLYANLQKWLIAAEFSVSNTPIKKELDKADKIRVKEINKGAKRIQLIINRKFNPTEDKVRKESKADILASA